MLSQYFIDERLITTNPAVFAVGDDFIGDNTAANMYLTFEPYKFRCTRRTIGTQVVLTHIENEHTYFVLRFDTISNAADFVMYISNFAVREPGLPLPLVLERFLGKRT